MLDHLGEGEFLALVRHRPAHPPEVVEQRLRQVAHALVEGDRGRILALGQLALVRVAQQWHVAQLRLLPAEILVELDQLGRRRQPLFAAQDVGDAHQVVVDHVGEEVGGQAVGLHQHLHVHAIPRNLDIAAEHVRHHADALGRHLHAGDVGLAGGEAALHLILRQVHAVAVVARGFLARHLLGANRIEALGRAEAGEGMALLDQFVRILLVDMPALALPVRAMRAADVRALVPFDAEPAQGVVDLLLGLPRRTQLVGVLDAQDELTAVLTREAQVEQRDVCGTDVRVARRRRGDASTNSGHGDSLAKRKLKRKFRGAMLSGGPPPAPVNDRCRPAGG